MTTDARLRLAKHLAEVRDREFAMTKRGDNPEPGRFADCLESTEEIFHEYIRICLYCDLFNPHTMNLCSPAEIGHTSEQTVTVTMAAE